jgi:hypothetical protein
MKIRKFLILLLGVFAMVVMLVSCCGYKQPGSTWPSTSTFTGAPSIATTAIEVTGDPNKKGETLRIEFDRNTGRCKGILVNNKEYACDDKDIAIPLTATYFCTEPDDKHPANTRIYGKKEAYCGNVEFLTEGADIRYLANPAAGNRKCKIIGGAAICYPP